MCDITEAYNDYVNQIKVEMKKGNINAKSSIQGSLTTELLSEN